MKAEFGLLLKMQHGNIVKVFGEPRENVVLTRPGKEDKQVAYIEMEAITNKDLFDYVSILSEPFEPNLARYYMKQLLQGVYHMHNQDIAHRDLKPENIVLDHEYCVKIIDFGFAKRKQDSSGTVLGTEQYYSPQIHF